MIQDSVWLAKQAVVAAVADQERLQEERNIGSARLEELQKEVDSSSDRIQQLKAMVVVSQRAGEIAADRTELVPEGLEELPQWMGCQWPWSGKISPWLPNCQHSWQLEG